MNPQKTASKAYLTRMMTTGIDPSFYHSEAYLDLSGAECLENEHWTWVQLEGWILFLPILITEDIKNLINEGESFPPGNIWCTNLANEQEDWQTYQPEFLDWEYIFDPGAFNTMDGGKWNTFRKNVRKWPRENPEHYYSDVLLDESQLEPLLGEWLENRAENAQDAEIMIKYVFSTRPDVGQKYMYNGKRELVGVNVWDSNYKYINYRLCIVKAGERFLDEFMRYQFYKDPWLWLSGKKVNDGGSLGREGLERFKDKMNPLYKRKRYSLIKAKPNEN